MLLRRLSEAFGPPGQEGIVRDIIRREITPHVDRVWTDALGNLLWEKKAIGDSGTRVFLAAHMDEVALMITVIEKSGFLRFKPMGGLDQRVLVSKAVAIGTSAVPGVIGAKPIHLLEAAERKQAFQLRDLYIDIGATCKEEAEQLVTLGDGAVFATPFAPLSDSNRFKGKAFDNRVGCGALVELLKSQYPVNLIGAFTVQEEVGLRGARVAAYGFEADYALVLETTTAADVPRSEAHQQSTSLGEGPALTVVDGTVIAHKPLVNQLVALAEIRNYLYQLRRTTSGGTDAGVIQLTQCGIPTAVISVPCRYIHSPVGIFDHGDYEGLIKLVQAFLEELPRTRRNH